MYEKDYHILFSPFRFLFAILLLQFWCGAPDTTVQRITFTVLQVRLEAKGDAPGKELGEKQLEEQGV